MKSDTRIKLYTLRTVIFTALIILCAFIIFMSGETSEISSGRSDGISRTLLRSVFGFLSLGEPTDSTVEALELFIRKGAHFSAYAAMSFLCLSFLFTFAGNSTVKYAASFLYCLAFAVSDEYHQTFVSGRWGSARDVLLDCTGVLFSCAVFFFISKYIGSKRDKTVK